MMSKERLAPDIGRAADAVPIESLRAVLYMKKTCCIANAECLRHLFHGLYSHGKTGLYSQCMKCRIHVRERDSICAIKNVTKTLIIVFGGERGTI